jgi:hypothetical protein
LIQPGLGVSDPVKRIVSELCELGWLYKKIDSFIKVANSNPAFTVQSFIFAIQNELNEYYKLIAVLD